VSGISFHHDGPVGRIRLDQPARRNAMSRAMWLGLAELCAEIEMRTNILIVLVEGAGGHFCAGADISEFNEVYRDAASTRDYGGAIQRALLALEALDRPTIAAMRGNCIGGGLAIALACDLRFCASDALLAITPAKLGLFYGHAETRRLVELVGPSRAKDLLFCGRRVECGEALAIGLVNRAIPAEALETAIQAYALELCQLSHQSIRGAKKGVGAIVSGLVTEDASFRAMIEDAALGEDFLEGRTAFAEKRRPKFTYRGRSAGRAR
jgi:enoyl-CoA hydratase/carnithine racemase